MISFLAWQDYEALDQWEPSLDIPRPMRVDHAAEMSVYGKMRSNTCCPPHTCVIIVSEDSTPPHNSRLISITSEKYIYIYYKYPSQWKRNIYIIVNNNHQSPPQCVVGFENTQEILVVDLRHCWRLPDITVKWNSELHQGIGHSSAENIQELHLSLIVRSQTFHWSEGYQYQLH